MMLSDDDLQAAEYRARQFSGAYTGTSGTLAADSIRQIKYIRHIKKELQRMTATLEESNRQLREAVEARLANGGAADAACCEGGRCHPAASDEEYERQEIPVDWILQGERELKVGREAPRLLGAGVIADGGGDESPAERLLLDAAAAVRDRRRRYGPPRDHFAITVALINAVFGTEFKPEDWATIMQLDKIARSRGPGDHPDNDIDGAGYAACRAECREHP